MRAHSGGGRVEKGIRLAGFAATEEASPPADSRAIFAGSGTRGRRREFESLGHGRLIGRRRTKRADDDEDRGSPPRLFPENGATCGNPGTCFCRITRDQLRGTSGSRYEIIRAAVLPADRSLSDGLFDFQRVEKLLVQMR